VEKISGWEIVSALSSLFPFTFLTCYLKQAPDIVVYDFACGLMEYCLNRAPDYFKYCRFVVDRFHIDNHVGCSKALGKVQFYSSGEGNVENTSLCEQVNKHMKRYKRTFQNMKQYSFMTLLRSVLESWNVKKYAKLVKGGEVSCRAAERNHEETFHERSHPFVESL